MQDQLSTGDIMTSRYNVQSFYVIQNDTNNFSIFNAITDKAILHNASAKETSDFLLINSPFHPGLSWIESKTKSDQNNDSYSYYCADLSGDCDGLDLGFTQTPTYSYSYDAVEEWYDPYNSAIQLEFDFNKKNNPHKITNALNKILQEEVESSDWKEFPEDSE